MKKQTSDWGESLQDSGQRECPKCGRRYNIKIKEIDITTAGIFATLPSKSDHTCYDALCTLHPDPLHRVSEHIKSHIKSKI